MIEKFSGDVIKKINDYVYRLIDPRNGETFYVGRGKGNRVFDHVKGEFNYSEEVYQDSDDESISSEFADEISDKIARINEIKASGLEVIYVIHRWGLTTDEAKEVEAALIDCYPGLTNVQNGYGAERGINNASAIENMLKTQKFDEKTDIDFCIIKVHQETINLCGLYEAVRKSWRVNVDRISKIPYILAVCNGIVKEVYKVEKWLPDKEMDSKRYMFEGKKADEDIREHFVNKKLPDYYRKAQYPVVYKKVTDDHTIAS